MAFQRLGHIVVALAVTTLWSACDDDTQTTSPSPQIDSTSEVIEHLDALGYQCGPRPANFDQGFRDAVICSSLPEATGVILFYDKPQATEYLKSYPEPIGSAEGFFITDDLWLVWTEDRTIARSLADRLNVEIRDV